MTFPHAGRWGGEVKGKEDDCQHHQCQGEPGFPGHRALLRSGAIGDWRLARELRRKTRQGTCAESDGSLRVSEVHRTRVPAAKPRAEWSYEGKGEESQAGKFGGSHPVDTNLLSIGLGRLP